eukprot:9466253-Pyramimonas_sp.AAC.1
MAWQIPNTSPDDLPAHRTAPKGSLQIWSGTDKDENRITVAFTKKKDEKWIQMKKGNGQLMQWIYPLEKETECKRLAQTWAEKYCAGELDKPAMEAAKNEFNKEFKKSSTASASKPKPMKKKHTEADAADADGDEPGDGGDEAEACADRDDVPGADEDEDDEKSESENDPEGDDDPDAEQA